MSVMISEQETVINFARDEETAEIWTSDRTIMTKLDRLVEKSRDWTLKEEEKDTEGELIAKVYTARKKSLISFRGTVKRMTEEQKAKMTEVLARARCITS